MRLWFYLTSALLSSVVWACGQVQVEVQLENEQFLAREPLVVAVRITNYSGQKLRLGKEPDWLKFAVEARGGSVVSKLADPPVTGEFEVESATTATRRVDLAPYFEIAQPGRYAVTAVVNIPQWNRDLSTQPKGFDIISGAKLWEQDFGLPAAGEPGHAEPEVRKFALLQVNRAKQISLYVRLSDPAESRVYRVYPIGTLVSFSKPEGQIDRTGHLHILHQKGARTFNYCVINPDGELASRQTHEYTATRPALSVDADGKIGVTGGVRRISANDVPPPAAPSPVPDAKPPKS